MSPTDAWRHRNQEAARMIFRGKIDCDSFAEFAQHRAAKLDLEFEMSSCDSGTATFSVTGQEAMVDAFEMACSLGPYDCIVVDVERLALPWSAAIVEGVNHEA